jgi:hypothetical protein
VALKNARLARAEDLTPETRRKYGLPDTGLIVIESLNPELHENIQSITENNGGISGYLRSFGSFIEADITGD